MRSKPSRARRQRIDLYQLHAPDPRTPLSTSVRALAALRNEGLVERVGLCNVNVSQIEEARRITDISAVQIELSSGTTPTCSTESSSTASSTAFN